MTSKIRILKTNTFETPSIPYGRSSMKKENLYEEKGKTNSTSNEESNEKEERSAFINIVIHDLSSRIFLLEDIKNQVFQPENLKSFKRFS